MKFVILDNIRSAHNVGSIFRTSDGAGVAKIFLVGVTPCPVDRFGRPQPEIVKTSLGAAGIVPWEQVGDADAVLLVRRLRSEGVTVAAVEQTANAVSLDDFQVPENVAYILGNEVDGVSDALIKESDQALEIPMAGEKESLNVSVAAGIVLFKKS
jgi:tRNA G18 (ribose-2'-O)-methylase SpoU